MMIMIVVSSWSVYQTQFTMTLLGGMVTAAIFKSNRNTHKHTHTEPFICAESGRHQNVPNHLRM